MIPEYLFLLHMIVIRSAVGILYIVLIQTLESSNIWILKSVVLIVCNLFVAMYWCVIYVYMVLCLMAGIAHRLVLFQQTLALAKSQGTHLR